MIRITYLLLAVLLVLPQGLLASSPSLSGKVTWIYDGDTIKVEEIGKVRLIGIDVPEREDSSRDGYYLKKGISRKRLRRVSRDALHFLIDQVKGKQVTLQTDTETHDRHGRRLAYVYLPDGVLLNQLLLEKGYAAVYRKFQFRLKNDFLKSEGKAAQDGIGLWAE